MTGAAQSPEPLSKSALAKRLKPPLQPLFLQPCATSAA